VGFFYAHAGPNYILGLHGKIWPCFLDVMFRYDDQRSTAQKIHIMYRGNYLPNWEKNHRGEGFNISLMKKIWPFALIPTKFVGYLFDLCTKQHISPFSKPQFPAVVVAVVCRKASHIILPRMGAGPA
jgi:hypothetical protein